MSDDLCCFKEEGERQVSLGDSRIKCVLDRLATCIPTVRVEALEYS